MTRLLIRYMTDDGDVINKPTHYISVFENYNRVASFDGKTKADVRKKITQWLINNKIVEFTVTKRELDF